MIKYQVGAIFPSMRRRYDTIKPYTSPTSELLGMIRKIPKGKVASYGQIAALAGQPRGARQVARMLHSLSDREGLPWQRVINSSGRISLPMDGVGSLQRRLLLREGVEVDALGRVELDRYGWEPEKPGKPRRARR
jgi:methylated-DNA-protein-cysteine methyltransferase-like protein